MTLPDRFELLLASKSPRRSQLLKQANIPFRFLDIDVEETYPEELPALEVAPFLAQKKAAAAVELLTSDEQIALTADSVVILDEIIYGKPTDRDDAVRILQALSGRMHTVVTGICLRSKQREAVRSGVSQVYFHPLSQEEIDYYIDTFQPYDKAGAYAIQEWIGLCKIYRIDGTYDNIMGLPVNLVYECLRNWQKD